MRPEASPNQVPFTEPASFLGPLSGSEGTRKEARNWHPAIIIILVRMRGTVGGEGAGGPGEEGVPSEEGILTSDSLGPAPPPRRHVPAGATGARFEGLAPGSLTLFSGRARLVLEGCTWVGTPIPTGLALVFAHLGPPLACPPSPWRKGPCV